MSNRALRFLSQSTVQVNPRRNNICEHQEVSHLIFWLHKHLATLLAHSARAHARAAAPDMVTDEGGWWDKVASSMNCCQNNSSGMEHPRLLETSPKTFRRGVAVPLATGHPLLPSQDASARSLASARSSAGTDDGNKVRYSCLPAPLHRANRARCLSLVPARLTRTVRDVCCSPT